MTRQHKENYIYKLQPTLHCSTCNWFKFSSWFDSFNFALLLSVFMKHYAVLQSYRS